MTRKNHSTGTDRVSEVSKKYNYDWILNIQGDEPLINIGDIKKLILKLYCYIKKKIFCFNIIL